MLKIKLDFPSSQGQKFYAFPLPTNNVYQQVKILIWPQDYQLVKDENDNQLLLFPTTLPNALVFKHRALAVKKTTQKLDFLRVESEQLVNNNFINPHDPAILALAKSFMAGASEPEKIVKNIYEETLKYLSYGRAIRDLHPYTQALEEKVTDCGGFATFLASLLGSQGFQTRLAVGYLLKNTWRQQLKKAIKSNQTWSDISMHAWLEVALSDGSYLPLDAAVDWRYRHGQSQRQASFAQLEADRLLLSYGCDQELSWQGEKFSLPIWQHPEMIEIKDV